METQQWLNRIVGYGSEDPEQILANPFNWRIHTQMQQEAFLGVVKDVGIVQNIIINTTTQHLVDGHMRVLLAIREQQRGLPVTYVELTEEEEAEVLATYDPISAMAVADRTKFEETLRRFNSDSPSVQNLASQLAIQHGIVEGFDPNAEWVGMPEFEQESINAYHTIQVHFASEDAMTTFADLLGQNVTDKTRYIHYPYQADENLKPYQVIDES